MTRSQGLALLTIASLAVLLSTAVHAQTRERVPDPPGTSSVSPISFGGGWQTTINRTEAYTLVLRISNPMVNPLVSDLYVIGQLIRVDGASQYNGTLQGVVPKGTNTLSFSFAQPAANRGGSGMLMLSPDGNSIAGSSKAGEVYSTWRGTRAK